MTPILRTDRLDFHPFTPGDFDLLANLHADPQVQRYIGGLWDRPTLQRRLDQYVEEQARLGHSKWKVYLHDGTFVGRAGVSQMPDGELEVGYSFMRDAWGKGLATEAARGVVDWVFDHTGAETIIGFAHAANLASRRVLEKLGMRFEAQRPLGGLPTAFYRLRRA